MAWEDVPTKLAQYVAERYAPDDADTKLLNEYGALTLEHVPEGMREAFEADLDYRLGACVNLRNSKADRSHL